MNRNSYLTEAEHAFVGYLRSATDHVARVAFRHLIIADVDRLHIELAQRSDQFGHFLSARGRLKLEGQEDLGALGIVIPIHKLGSSTRVDHVMQCNETEMTGVLDDQGRPTWRSDGGNADVPSWLLRNLYAQQCFSSLSEFRTFRDKAQSVEVHVRAADDGDELLLCADKLVVENVALQCC